MNAKVYHASQMCLCTKLKPPQFCSFFNQNPDNSPPSRWLKNNQQNPLILPFRPCKLFTNSLQGTHHPTAKPRTFQFHPTTPSPLTSPVRPLKLSLRQLKGLKAPTTRPKALDPKLNPLTTKTLTT